MIQPYIGILDLQDAGKEAEAIRQSLEYFGYQTILYTIGRPDDFIQIISGRNRLSLLAALIICGHGKDDCLIMPKLADSVYLEEELRTNFGAFEIIQYAHFRQELILSTACGFGEAEVGSAFLRKGAKAFMAPTAEIEGNAALLFVIHFFYQYKQGIPIEKAYSLASRLDQETEIFKLFH